MELEELDFANRMDMELSKHSFPYFFQNVLGMMYPEYMEEWLSLMESTDRTVIICSRDHGKSVFMHSWVVWNLLFQEPPFQMLYISSNQKQTMVHMREIDRYFNLPALKQFKPSRGWAIGNITLTNGNSVLERSVGSQIRGLHPQEIIIDDPLKEFSIAGITRVTDWFFGDMIPTLHHTANLRMIGTPFTYTDIFSQLEENPAYTVRKYPCFNALEEPLWPERWDYDALIQRKADGWIMDLGGMENDYREGGVVPIGAKERADDVPARLSKNEFVFTADAVRNAGGGNIDKGAEVMQNMMDNLEAGGMISEESQGKENPAQAMFDQAQMLENRIV